MTGTGSEAGAGFRPGRRARAGAWAWLGCLQFFVAEALSNLGWDGRYSYRTNYISDLGAVLQSPRHSLMNSSFLLQGLLIAAGALLLAPRESGRPRQRWAQVSFVLAGLGVAVVGLCPEDSTPRLHVLGAALHFNLGIAGMLLWGVGCWKAARLEGAIALLGAGMAALGETLLFNKGAAAMLGAGLVERITAYPLPLVLAATGFLLLRKKAGYEQ